MLTDGQHGFRKRRSCESQLILTVNDIASSMDLKEQIDLSAFVSSVDLILLYKTQSSAKSLTFDPVEMTSGKSLMKSRNNSGPSTLPWGTPDCKQEKSTQI
jgi:hypothetical protein